MSLLQSAFSAEAKSVKLTQMSLEDTLPSLVELDSQSGKYKLIWYKSVYLESIFKTKLCIDKCFTQKDQFNPKCEWFEYEVYSEEDVMKIRAFQIEDTEASEHNNERSTSQHSTNQVQPDDLEAQALIS